MDKKMLIVYYSWACGNTERVAKILQEETSADIERIDTKKPYVGTYEDIVDIGKFEVETEFEPKLKLMEHDVDSYDIVAIGTPTWWYTMAPAVRTFLHDHNFKGKTIIPFSTNGGWPGHVISDIKGECGDLKFLDAIEAQFDSSGGDTMVTDEAEIRAWAKEIACEIEL